MWAWGLGWTNTLCTLLVPALPALGAGTLRVGGEGAVSNEKTWRQRRGREHTGSTGLIPFLTSQACPSPTVIQCLCHLCYCYSRKTRTFQKIHGSEVETAYMIFPLTH